MSSTHALAGLKAARTKAGINPQILADRIGAHLHSYYRFENGTRRIYFDKACALADTIGCSLDELRYDPDAGAQADTVVNLADGMPTEEQLGEEWVAQ